MADNPRIQDDPSLVWALACRRHPKITFPEGQECPSCIVENLAAIVRGACYHLNPARRPVGIAAIEFRSRALDYLKRKGLQGSPLRGVDKQEPPC